MPKIPDSVVLSKDAWKIIRLAIEWKKLEFVEEHKKESKELKDGALAEAIGVSRGLIIELRTGKRSDFPRNALLDLADKLGIDPSELTDDEEVKKQMPSLADDFVRRLRQIEEDGLQKTKKEIVLAVANMMTPPRLDEEGIPLGPLALKPHQITIEEIEQRTSFSKAKIRQLFKHESFILDELLKLILSSMGSLICDNYQANGLPTEPEEIEKVITRINEEYANIIDTFPFFMDLCFELRRREIDVSNWFVEEDVQFELIHFLEDVSEFYFSKTMEELFMGTEELFEFQERIGTGLKEAAFSSSTLGAVMSTHIWYIFGFGEKLHPVVFRNMTKFFLYGWLSWNKPELAIRAVSMKLNSVELTSGEDEKEKIALALLEYLDDLTNIDH